jgi:hypothetical protein
MAVGPEILPAGFEIIDVGLDHVADGARARFLEPHGVVRPVGAELEHDRLLG